MKLTDLKSPYRELAEMRREQRPIKSEEKEFLMTNFLEHAFEWDYTLEEHSFWEKVNNGELPAIPQSSLDELSAWQKGKEPKKSLADAWNEGRLKTIQMLNSSQYDRPIIDEAFCTALNPYDNILNKIKVPEFEPTAIIESPDHRLFTAAVAAMQGIIAHPEGLGIHLAALIMGNKPPDEKEENMKWWEEAEAKYCVRKAQALLNELNKVK